MKHTVLHQRHLQLTAKMTDFQGWQIPVQFSDPQNEYLAVRTAAGLFDAGFLGRIEVSGVNASKFLNTIVARNISKIPEGAFCYGLICNHQGGIISDALILHVPDNRYLITTNPINTEKLIAWLKKHAEDNITIAEKTQDIAQFALQGPRSERILGNLAAQHMKRMKPKTLQELTILDTTIIVSRASYTGEHGYEFFVQSDRAEQFWDAIMAAGSEAGILPCGFASRDILRLEMGYLLYGNDIDETRTPFEAGLASYLDFKKDFIGKDALVKMDAGKSKEKLVGFELLDKGLPKNGGSIFSENREIGTVTSCGQSPRVRKGIGLGYVASRYAQPGQEIEIEVRDHEVAARIVSTPFYHRP